MMLTVFGASGRTGRLLVDAALADGHQVTAVTRRPGAVAVEDRRLRVAVGELDDPSFMLGAVADADGVCSVLGSRAPRQATTLYSGGIDAILAAMVVSDVRRIVVVTAIPAEPAEMKSALERIVIHRLLHAFFGGGYDDMTRMEQRLAASDRDWTILRPPRLTNASAKGDYRTAIDGRLRRATSLPRADLAAAMLASVNDQTLIRHAVTIAT